MKDNRLSVLLIAYVAGILFCSSVARAEETICESQADKKSEKMEFKVGTFSQSGENIEITEPCSGKIFTIKKCAFITIHKKDRQHFCYPQESPAYFDTYDVIEYYEDQK